MRHAAGELADRLELLGLAQVALEPRRSVTSARIDRQRAVAAQPERDLDGQLAAVLAPGVEFERRARRVGGAATMRARCSS